MEALLNVNDLRVSFATNGGILKAVRGVSFFLNRGEVLGIAGESGSGKSVTAHSLFRLLPGNTAGLEGRVLFNGENLLEKTEEELRALRGSGISMIFQEPGRSFDQLFSIEKTMAETIRLHNPELSKEEVFQRSVTLLDEVKIPEPASRLKNFPHQFSGGMLQRIMIAISLASNPEILIADEPTTSLDVTIQAEIIRLLMELKEKRNLSIIFISHDLSLLANISDRIAVMYAGLIMEEGPVKEVLEAPHHPYTKALLDSVPKLGDHYSGKKVSTIPGSVPDPLHHEPGCPFAPRCGLAGGECREKIPEMTTEPRQYRCIRKGAK